MSVSHIVIESELLTCLGKDVRRNVTRKHVNYDSLVVFDLKSTLL
jgi:hypothetical protein